MVKQASKTSSSPNKPNRKYTSYLFVSSLESEKHIDHVSWYENHGGHGHEPAHSLTPAWVHIVSHFERNHLYGAEQEHTLWETRDALCILTTLTTGSAVSVRHGCRQVILTLFIISFFMS